MMSHAILSRPAEKVTTQRLYHYTCDHAVAGIRADRFVKPNMHPLLKGIALAWFTDLDAPDRDGLGLTSNYITCDRTTHRFTVADSAPIRWWPNAVRELDLQGYRRALEIAPGAWPAHWYVSVVPVVVE